MFLGTESIVKDDLEVKSSHSLIPGTPVESREVDLTLEEFEVYNRSPDLSAGEGDLRRLADLSSAAPVSALSGTLLALSWMIYV